MTVNPATYPAQRRGESGPEATTAGGAVSSVFGRIGAVIALLGDYTSSLISNVSTVPGATVSDALDWLASHAGAVTSVATRTGVITAAQLSGGGLEPNTALDALQVASNIPARGVAGVSVDLLPFQQKAAINTGVPVTITFTGLASKSQDIVARVWVDSADGTGLCVFARCLLNVIHRTTAGVATRIVSDQLQWEQTAVGFSFTSALVGNDLVFTLSNTSGTNRSYVCEISQISQDKA